MSNIDHIELFDPRNRSDENIPSVKNLLDKLDVGLEEDSEPTIPYKLKHVSNHKGNWHIVFREQPTRKEIVWLAIVFDTEYFYEFIERLETPRFSYGDFSYAEAISEIIHDDIFLGSQGGLDRFCDTMSILYRKDKIDDIMKEE